MKPEGRKGKGRRDSQQTRVAERSCLLQRHQRDQGPAVEALSDTANLSTEGNERVGSPDLHVRSPCSF